MIQGSAHAENRLAGKEKSWLGISFPNCLSTREALNNRYFTFRQGQGSNDALKLLAGSDDFCRHVLTETGKDEVKTSIRSWLENNRDIDPSKVRVLSSPLYRAEQSAGIICSEINLCFGTTLKPEIFQPLKERGLGELDGHPECLEMEIRDADCRNPLQTRNGVESAMSLHTRVNNLISDLESTCSGQIFFLVSHGDPLQVVEGIFLKVQTNHYSDIKESRNGECREMQLGLQAIRRN